MARIFQKYVSQSGRSIMPPTANTPPPVYMARAATGGSVTLGGIMRESKHKSSTDILSRLGGEDEYREDDDVDKVLMVGIRNMVQSLKKQMARQRI